MTGVGNLELPEGPGWFSNLIMAQNHWSLVKAPMLAWPQPFLSRGCSSPGPSPAVTWA